jgi:hypothetical protein
MLVSTDFQLPGMIRNLRLFSILIVLLICIFGVGVTYVNAKMELTVQKKLQFKEKPLSMVSSRDGKYLYILFEGKLLVYSLMENKRQYTISLDKNIDKITLSEKNELLILASSSEKTAQILKIDFIRQIDTSGLPYQGPQDAPVTVIAFIDYQ